MAGKIISINSVKGGVGKTTLAISLAGIYSLMKKKVLLIDLDLYSGGISTYLDINNKKDIFMLIDSISNNRFTSLNDYIVNYNKNIDVIPSVKDPRLATRMDSKYIQAVFKLARSEYDIIIVDTNHVLDETNLVVLDNVDISLYVITNDIVDLKNMKSLVSIFKDTEKTNYLTILNNSINPKTEYLSLFDIRTIIRTNIDYTISKNFYIKNINKYLLAGDILTLNASINNTYQRDINNLKKLATNVLNMEGHDSNE